MNNCRILDTGLGHLTYIEQKNIVKKLAKIKNDERALKNVLNGHMSQAKRDGVIPKWFNLKDYMEWLLKE